jgi:hypothetical protein
MLFSVLDDLMNCWSLGRRVCLYICNESDTHATLTCNEIKKESESKDHSVTALTCDRLPRLNGEENCRYTRHAHSPARDASNKLLSNIEVARHMAIVQRHGSF